MQDKKLTVGIYVEAPTIGAGGASSFSATINGEIEELSKQYRVVVLYSGNTKIQMPGGIHCVNVTEYKKKHYLNLVIRQIKSSIDDTKLFWRLHRPFNLPVSYMDDIAHDYGIDIFWFTVPADFYLTTPYICTVWDLGHRTASAFPEVSRPISEWEYRESYNENMISRATYIITGNETGKKEILENYRVSSDKIKVVPFEVSSFCKGTEKEPTQEIPEQYFLYPAQFWPHKNHIRIIEAVRILRDEYDTKVNFVFTGSDKGNRKYIESKVNEYGLEDQVFFLGFVADEELKYLYTHAKALVFASLMGPNNLPPIEAIYMGCPVIASGIDGHIEQMGDAALYFNPLSSDDLSLKLYKVLNDEQEWDEVKKSMSSFRYNLNNYSYIDNVIDILNEYISIRIAWE